jgi:hypothetical protein
VRPWAIFSETQNVANPAACNMTHINSQHRWKLLSLDVAQTRFTTLNNVFRNILKVFRNIERAPPPDRRLIETFIQILRLRIRPTLAPGSDVRALAVPFSISIHYSGELQPHLASSYLHCWTATSKSETPLRAWQCS